MGDLLPCPFCGGPAEVRGDTSTTVQCLNDQCIIGDPAPFNDFSHRYDAIAAWNTRAHSSQAVVSQDLVPVPPLASEIPPQAPAFASFRGEPEFATSLADRGGTSANPQAWLYASDDGSIEVVLNRDCQRAGELISAGWTEEPLYPASAIEAAQIAARNEALDEAAKAFEAEAETWVQIPQRGAMKRQGAKAIRSLRTPSQHQEAQ